MKPSYFIFLFVFAGIVLTLPADSKKLNSINCARVLAERSIVETVYGVKLRFIEEVTNLTEGNFLGTTETKTGQRSIKGIEFIEKYDPKTDIAQITAVLKLKRIKDIIDTEKFQLDKFPEKTIQRTAFASSTPANAKKLSALRAAELDAYKNLYKKIGGFTLESHSKVENFVLKSDKVKSTVVGALMGAEYVGFSWEGKGDTAEAVVKLRLNLKELADMLGEKIIDYDKEYVEAEGNAAQSDLVAEKPQAQPENKRLAPKLIEGNVDVLP
ncbi:MAG: hypothetical protein A2017_15345 [Lentisphaerae bacterium GWF2_44_16]|nr:MAG: hypothetical protein A2017_15345 [Lentisphaerae bacterium GWF2_44_16]